MQIVDRDICVVERGAHDDTYSRVEDGVVAGSYFILSERRCIWPRLEVMNEPYPKHYVKYGEQCRRILPSESSSSRSELYHFVRASLQMTPLGGNERAVAELCEVWRRSHLYYLLLGRSIATTDSP